MPISRLNKVIGITMGDAAGIGVEVILKALANKEFRKRQFLVIGDKKVIKAVFLCQNKQKF